MGTIAFNDHPPTPLRVGQDLLGAMLDGQVPVMYLCMAGSCGRCKVEVTQGLELLEPPNRSEEYRGCSGAERLACQARLAADGAIAVKQ